MRQNFSVTDACILTGKSNAFRTVLSVGVFLGCLNATHNLVGSCLAAVLAQLAGVCLFDFSVIGHLPQVDWEVRSGRVGLLFKEKCSPVFIGYPGFLYFSAAKYAIEGNMADKYQGGIRCDLHADQRHQSGGRLRHPARISRNSRISGSGMRSGICRDDRPAGGNHRGAYGAGSQGCPDSRNPVLSILYPKIAYMLRECRPALVFIILGGAFNAYVNLFYYALIIMQEQKRIFWVMSV